MENRERNAAIAERIRAGESLSAVGRDLGLTRERVRQIALRQGVVAPRLTRDEPCSLVGCPGRCWPLSPEPYCAYHRKRLREGKELLPVHKVLKRDTHGTLMCYRNGCRCELCHGAFTEFQRDMKKRRRARVADTPHGTASGYTNWGCRCNPCREAAYREYRASKERLTQRGREHPELIPHGTVSGYMLWSCKCDLCRGLATSKRRHTASKQGDTSDTAVAIQRSNLDYLAQLTAQHVSASA